MSERRFSFNKTAIPEPTEQKKHGVQPVETFLSINAVEKNGKITFIVDETTRYLVSGSYLDKVVETAQARAAAKRAVR